MTEKLYGYSAKYVDLKTNVSYQVSKPGSAKADAVKAVSDLVDEHDAGGIKLQAASVFPMTAVAAAPRPQ